MRSIMNEVSKYIGTVVIILVLLLIILRTLNWQTDVIKRMMITREGFDDDDDESECDEEETREKIHQIYKTSKKYKGADIDDENDLFGALKYHKEHYDSDDEWDSETEELKKICNRMKKHSVSIEYKKEINDIIGN